MCEQPCGPATRSSLGRAVCHPRSHRTRYASGVHSSDDTPTTAAAWTCPRCDEPVDAGFDQCWNCGSDHQGNVDPDFTPHVAPRHEHINCRSCGYPLRHLDRARCPECGRAFDPKQMDTPLPDPPTPRQEAVARQRLQRWFQSWLTIIGLAIVSVFAFPHSRGTPYEHAIGFAVVATIILATFWPVGLFRRPRA